MPLVTTDLSSYTLHTCRRALPIYQLHTHSIPHWLSFLFFLPKLGSWLSFVCFSFNLSIFLIISSPPPPPSDFYLTEGVKRLAIFICFRGPLIRLFLIVIFFSVEIFLSLIFLSFSSIACGVFCSPARKIHCGLLLGLWGASPFRPLPDLFILTGRTKSASGRFDWINNW